MLVCHSGDTTLGWLLRCQICRCIEVKVECGRSRGRYRFRIVHRHPSGNILSAIGCSHIAPIDLLGAQGNQLLIYDFHAIILRVGVGVTHTTLVNIIRHHLRLRL